jgi:capsular polysaccharide biosynthesis protein
MSLLDVLNIARRRGWIILLAAALTAASAYAFSKLQTPIYQSTVLISVRPSRPDLGTTETAKRFLRNYVAELQTSTYARKVIDVLGLDTTSDSLLGNAIIDSDDSRFTIQIDIRNPNGDLANDIARVWAEEFKNQREIEKSRVRREDQIDANILDAPRYSLYRPQTTINVLAGGILGALVGGLIIFVLEYLEANIVRSRQDLERGLGLAVLSSVPVLETGKRK